MIRRLHESDNSAFVIEGLLSSSECEHIASLPRSFQKSYVGGAGAGSRLDLQTRDAETAILFQARWKDPTHRNISDRILQHAARLPARSPSGIIFSDGRPLDDSHLEFAQITRYASAGHYIWHRDGTPAACNTIFAWTECRGCPTLKVSPRAAM